MTQTLELENEHVSTNGRANSTNSLPPSEHEGPARVAPAQPAWTVAPGVVGTWTVASMLAGRLTFKLKPPSGPTRQLDRTGPRTVLTTPRAHVRAPRPSTQGRMRSLAHPGAVGMIPNSLER